MQTLLAYCQVAQDCAKQLVAVPWSGSLHDTEGCIPAAALHCDTLMVTTCDGIHSTQSLPLPQILPVPGSWWFSNACSTSLFNLVSSSKVVSVVSLLASLQADSSASTSACSSSSAELRAQGVSSARISASALPALAEAGSQLVKRGSNTLPPWHQLCVCGCLLLCTRHGGLNCPRQGPC